MLIRNIIINEISLHTCQNDIINKIKDMCEKDTEERESHIVLTGMYIGMPILDRCVKMHKKQKTDYCFVQQSYSRVLPKDMKIRLLERLPYSVLQYISIMVRIVTEPT